MRAAASIGKLKTVGRRWPKTCGWCGPRSRR